MSATSAAHHARLARNATTVDAKLDKIAEAIEDLANAVRDIDREVDRIKSETGHINSRVNSLR